MAVSFIFMLYSPKPELIFDAGNMAVGIKNKEGKLEIYADKMAAFNRIYWANWFGQKDSKILPLKDNIFITNYGQRIVFSEDIVNSVKLGYKERGAKPIGNRKTTSNDVGELKSIDYNYCKEAEIYINLNHKAKCTGTLITINRNFLNRNPVILIFCNSKKCRIKSNNAASYT